MYLRAITVFVIFIGVTFNVIAEYHTDEICGTQVTENQYPWYVGIVYDNRRNDSIVELTRFVCSGNLITIRHAVSPAHCHTMDHMNPVAISVLLGPLASSSRLNCTEGDNNCTATSTIEIPIKTVIPHPKFRRLSPQKFTAAAIYDIALIILRKPVPNSDVIRPICLPSIDITQVAASDRELYLTGFDRSHTIENITQVQHHTTVEYFDRVKCQELFNNTVTEIPEDQICANDAGGAGGIATNLVSGSPLMNKRRGRYELVGLVNYGRKTWKNNIPTQFTNLFYNLEWILSRMFE